MIASLVLAALTVSGAWSRPAVTTGVVYATVHNHGARPVALVGVSSPVAGGSELHESTTSSMQMQGMAMPMVAMHPVARIVVPPHGAVTLRPGGYHIMLLDLHRPLRAGTTFLLVMRFADGEVVRVPVAVENRAM